MPDSSASTDREDWDSGEVRVSPLAAPIRGCRFCNGGICCLSPFYLPDSAAVMVGSDGKTRTPSAHADARLSVA